MFGIIDLRWKERMKQKIREKTLLELKAMKRATDPQETVLHDCPMCEGRGKLNMELRVPTNDIGRAAHELREKGYSLRECAEKLGLNKNVASHVSYYINQYNKTKNI